MSISFVTSTPLTQSAQARTLTGTPGNTAGHLLVALIAVRSAVSVPSVISVTDAGGNTWHQAPPGRAQSGSDFYDCWYSVTTAIAGLVTITVDKSTDTTVSIILEASSTIGWAASPLDIAVYNSGAASTAQTSGTSGTTAQGSEFACGFVAQNNGSCTWSGFTGGFTTQARAVSTPSTVNLVIQTGYDILTSTGTLVFAATGSTSSVWGAGVFSFKEAAAVTFTPRPIATRLDRMHSKTQSFSGSVQRLAPAAPPPSSGVLTQQIATVRSYWTA